MRNKLDQFWLDMQMQEFTAIELCKLRENLQLEIENRTVGEFTGSDEAFGELIRLLRDSKTKERLEMDALFEKSRKVSAKLFAMVDERRKKELPDLKEGEWYRDVFNGQVSISLFNGWDKRSIGVDYDGDFVHDHEWFFKDNYKHNFDVIAVANKQEVINILSNTLIEIHE